MRYERNIETIDVLDRTPLSDERKDTICAAIPEVTVEVTVTYFCPGRPAKISGPPEHCHPAEPMEYETDKGAREIAGELVRKIDQATHISVNEAVEIFCAALDLEKRWEVFNLESTVAEAVAEYREAG